MQKIIIEEIEVELTKKNIKNINLSIQAPNGKVKISAPRNIADETIRQFIVSKIPWIRKQQQRFKDHEKLPEVEFVSGESFFYFGQPYILNVIYQKSNRYKVVPSDNKFINLYVQDGSSKEKREKIMKEWYREELKVAIPPIIEKWEGIMGLKVEAWGVKQMKTRWGTCNIRDKRIWINLELAKKSYQCLEYIIVHEMAHLIERGHGDRFKAIMNKYYPVWRIVKAELNGLK